MNAAWFTGSNQRNLNCPGISMRSFSIHRQPKSRPELKQGLTQERFRQSARVAWLSGCILAKEGVGAIEEIAAVASWRAVAGEEVAEQ
jgi:hypothetical protein